MSNEAVTNPHYVMDNFSVMSDLNLIQRWKSPDESIFQEETPLQVPHFQFDQTSDGEQTLSPHSNLPYTFRPIARTIKKRSDSEPRRWLYSDQSPQNSQSPKNDQTSKSIYSPKNENYEAQSDQPKCIQIVVPHSHFRPNRSSAPGLVPDSNPEEQEEITLEDVATFVSDKTYSGKIEGSFCERLKRQQLSGFYFLPSASCAVCFTSILGVLLIIMGVALLMVTSTIIETELPYDSNCSNNSSCLLPFSINDTMASPVYVYIKIWNVYQNHHLYISSINADQLAGKDVPLSALSDCAPITTVGDLSPKQQSVLSGVHLNSSAVANPCGLFANNYFTDTFNLMDQKNASIPMATNNIAWSVDRNDNFKRNSNYLTTQWVDVEDERFMNWMNFATLFNWKKLWGRIDSDLPIGNYTLSINSTYDISGFQGRKSIMFSTVSVFGGTNLILGVICTSMGSCYFFIAAIVFMCSKVKRLKAYKRQNPNKCEWE